LFTNQAVASFRRIAIAPFPSSRVATDQAVASFRRNAAQRRRGAVGFVPPDRDRTFPLRARPPIKPWLRSAEMPPDGGAALLASFRQIALAPFPRRAWSPPVTYTYRIPSIGLFRQ
jgi:hypothetical protein